MNNQVRKLKRVVIKEELVALTGDYIQAILLNQLLYWSERTKDADKFLEEEIKRARIYGTEEHTETTVDVLSKTLTRGWIYKTAEELSEECMLGLSKATIGRYLKPLIANGWLDVRRNPKCAFDNTKQYRVNVVKIQSDLEELGYPLDGYSLKIKDKQEPEVPQHDNENSQFQNETSKLQKREHQTQNATTIPEITTETTFNNISSSSTDEPTKKIEEEEVKKILAYCQQCNYHLKRTEVELLLQAYPTEQIIKAIATASSNNDIKQPYRYLLAVLNDLSKDKNVTIKREYKNAPKQNFTQRDNAVENTKQMTQFLLRKNIGLDK